MLGTGVKNEKKIIEYILRCFPVPMHSSVLPTFSSMKFNVAIFILSLLIHLDLNFVHSDRYGSIFILLNVDIQLCQHPLLNMLSFFHFIFFASLSKIRYVD